MRPIKFPSFTYAPTFDKSREMAPKHWEHPVLALNTGHLRRAIINGTLSKADLALHTPPRQVSRPWLTNSDEMRRQQELLYTFQNKAAMNGSWDNTEHYVHGKDTELVLYLQDFPVDRWMLPIEAVLGALHNFLKREKVRWQGRSILEKQRRKSALAASFDIEHGLAPAHAYPAGARNLPRVTGARRSSRPAANPLSTRVGRVSGSAPSGGALRLSGVTPASVSTTPGVTTGTPGSTQSAGARVAPRPSRAQATAGVLKVPGVPRVRSSCRLAAAITNAAPRAPIASQSTVASTSTLPISLFVSQSGGAVFSAPLAPANDLYAPNPVPEVIRDARPDRLATVAFDPSNFPWVQARSDLNSGQWTDKIYTKSRLREFDAVQTSNEPRALQLMKEGDDTSGDNTHRLCQLKFVDDDAKENCKQFTDFTDIQKAIEDAASRAQNHTDLDTVMINYGSEKKFNLQRPNFSIVDAARTYRFLNESSIISSEAAHRIIDFCPHLLRGNVLLRIMAEACMSQSDIRHRLLLNGAVLSPSTISRRMRVALGHGWATKANKEDTEERKARDKRVDINTANFEKYKKEFSKEVGDERQKVGKAKAPTSSVAKITKAATPVAGKVTSRKRAREEGTTAPDPKRLKTRSQTKNETGA